MNVFFVYNSIQVVFSNALIILLQYDFYSE